MPACDPEDRKLNWINLNPLMAQPPPPGRGAGISNEWNSGIPLGRPRRKLEDRGVEYPCNLIRFGALLGP